MPKNTFSWLHLTDFHYGLKGQDYLWPTLREPFLDSLASLHERCGPWDAVLLTGDLAQSGESAQFAKMQVEVLEPLWERLHELDSGDAVLLAVPGNHDLFRPNPKEDNAAIDTLLEKDGFQRIEAKFWNQPAGTYRRVISDAFAAYSQWWNKAPHRPATVKTGALPGDFSVTLQVGGRTIGIVGLNTTFLQLAGGNYKGRLVWDASQLQAVCEGGVDTWSKQHDVCLVLTHQGPNWLTPKAYEQGELEITPAGRFAAHLFGHHHETEITYIRQSGGRNAVHLCQGRSLFGMDKFGEPPNNQRTYGYTAGRIELGEKKASLRLWPRIATCRTGPWRFIPDHDNAELEDDQGTPPEPVALRPRIHGTPQDRISSAVVAPVEATFSTLGLTAPHSTLPSRRPFFGRTKDLERIAKYLLPEDRSWGVVLDGSGGLGKTALALEAAHRAPIEHYPFKLWFTVKDRELLPHGVQPLQDRRITSFNALLNELGLVLGHDDIPKAVPENRPRLVRQALANRRALLVLDNLEALTTEERRQVFELLNNLPTTCRAIVTSRRRADGSTAAHNLRLDKLERDAADELLAELGRYWEPVSRLNKGERDRLYAETGGNPLLLTWVAGQLGRTTGRCRTVSEAIQRLQEAHRLLKINENNDPLDFVFGDLAETFTSDEIAVLAALAHFTKPVPIEWLLPLAELSWEATELALEGLRDRALLVEDEQTASWLLPPLAARFLRRTRPEAVGSSGERLAGQAYALALENGYKEYSRFPVLEAAWPKLAAALPVLIVSDSRRLQTVCAALFTFLHFSGRWDDLLSLSTEAERVAERAGDLDSAGWRAYEAGFCQSLRGQFAEVLACADRVSSYWQAVRAGASERATAMFLRGLGHKLAKNYAAAYSAFSEALALWRSQSQESLGLATTLNGLADVLREWGQPEDAEPLYREALEISEDLKDPEGISLSKGNLAGLALDRGKSSEAEILFREALRLAEELRHRELIAQHSANLARALAGQGRGSEGRSHSERAMAIFTELRSPELGDVNRKIILENSLHDLNEDVRRSGIEALARLWPTAETQEIAHSFALHDLSASVREASIELLARVFADDEDTIRMLHDLAANHTESSTRLKAAKELASLRWGDASIRALIRGIVASDYSDNVKTMLRSHVSSLKAKLTDLWQDYLSGYRERQELPETLPGYPAIHVKHFRLRNIGVFADTGLVNIAPQITLLLGDNATGKSTILKCLALAAVGSDAANEVEQSAASYLRRGSRSGIIEVSFSLIPDPDCFEEEYGFFSVGLRIEANSDRFSALPDSDFTLTRVAANANNRLNEIRNETGFSFGLSCAYAATRTFSQSRFVIEREHPREANEWIIPLFYSDAGIINPDVLSRIAKGDTRNINIPAESIDEATTNAIKQSLSYLLPAHTEMNAQGPFDVRLNDVDLMFAELSDGYKSLLAVLGHLTRSSLRLTKGLSDPTRIFGLVLMDELDLHLHPEWQRTIVAGLRKAFPNIQFVASTHSPLIAATCTPEEIRITETTDEGSTTVKQYRERIYGLDAEQALLSSYFNLDTTRAPGVENERSRLADLIAEGSSDAALLFIRSFGKATT